MEPLTGILILVSVLGLFAVYRIIKKVFKILATVILVVSIVLGLLTILLYQDVQELQEKFPTENKLFILELDEEIKAAFIVGAEGTEPIFIEDLSTMNKANKIKDYPTMLGDNYILFLYKEKDITAKKINIVDQDFEKEFVIQMLKSNTPNDLFRKRLDEINGRGDFVIKGAETDNEFKALLFSALFLEQQDSFLDQAKTIFVYPQITAFKILKYIPTRLTNIIGDE